MAKQSAVIVDGSAHWRSSRATTNGASSAISSRRSLRRWTIRNSAAASSISRAISAHSGSADDRRQSSASISDPNGLPAVELVGTGVNHAEAGWLGKDLGKEPRLADPSLALEQYDLADVAEAAADRAELTRSAEEVPASTP